MASLAEVQTVAFPRSHEAMKRKREATESGSLETSPAKAKKQVKEDDESTQGSSQQTTKSEPETVTPRTSHIKKPSPLNEKKSTPAKSLTNSTPCKSKSAQTPPSSRKSPTNWKTWRGKELCQLADQIFQSFDVAAAAAALKKPEHEVRHIFHAVVYFPLLDIKEAARRVKEAAECYEEAIEGENKGSPIVIAD